MAKKMKQREKTETNGAAPAPVKRAAPSGYEKQATDLVGFWDPNIVAGETTPIHFVPLEVKLFDSKLEPRKVSAIVVGKLVDPMPLSAPGGEGEVVEGAAGDLVGVWYKPGMSALKTLANVKVYMVPTGEISTGKPNPMKTYDCLSAKKGAELHVTQDLRKQSAFVETSFAGAGPKGDPKANAQHAPDQGADDIPF
jgi:hypothetical protein